MPRSLGELPHLASFELNLLRRFRHRGAQRSYSSSSSSSSCCPVPPNFTAGFIVLARAFYYFADGRQLSSEAVRSCRVR